MQGGRYMKRKSKKLSNSFSTGGGGYHFEAHVQASFVTLMLSGGYAPCLPCWPIVEIKLQGKIEGFDTDDIIVIVENILTKEKRKLLIQVKHSINITRGCTEFGEVIQSAWNDFNNSDLFVKGKDKIALITGPISATDEYNVQWLLNHAKYKEINEFFRDLNQANYCPSKAGEKFNAFKHHLKIANGGKELSNDEIYYFMKHFCLQGYDLCNENGVVQSLIQSHISQFQQQYPSWVWSRIVDVVQTYNEKAAAITCDDLPEDILDAFKQKSINVQPDQFKVSYQKLRTDWEQFTDLTYLSLVTLIGAWNEKYENDMRAVGDLLGTSYSEWLKKARILLTCPDSPLSLKNGIWRVRDRPDLLKKFGAHILDQDLETFKSIAEAVLSERDPAFDLPVRERYAASIHGKVRTFSQELRQGISEGLAILGSQSEACSNCSLGKAEDMSALVTRKILTDADWVLWGSLNSLLPSLSEASPCEFLNSVEKALQLQPCPFDELFAQEGDGIFGGNYLTGLLWALEVLAWDDKYLVRVCVLLGKLAERDPGGLWNNRPSNSLATILLPWLPQTLAPFEKHKVVVRTLLSECPKVAWNLIIKLLPNQIQTSPGSQKPSWRMIIPDDLEMDVDNNKYWEQVTFYAEHAIIAAGYDTKRLSELIDHFEILPCPAFDKLVDVLSSQEIIGLSEDQRYDLWNHLMKFTRIHHCYLKTQSSLPLELIINIENIAKQLAPSDPIYLYQPIFTDYDFDLYDGDLSLDEHNITIDEQRQNAIKAILKKYGLDGVIRFAENVVLQEEIGDALGIVGNDSIEKTFLPSFLDMEERTPKALVGGFIRRKLQTNGWDWCDNINKSEWTPEQVAYFLKYLPFTNEVWGRASAWLGRNEDAYWHITPANPYGTDGDLGLAIEKLLEYNRPNAAINCLYKMLHSKQPINVGQCVRSLLAAPKSDESIYELKAHRIVELINFLQSETSVNQEDIFKIEWNYLSLLDNHKGASPKLLEHKLSSDPEFFCEAICLIYRSKNNIQTKEQISEKTQTIALNVSRLLRGWKIPPGLENLGSFNPEKFNEWLAYVKKKCTESGHLEVALIHIGEVLIYAPTDPDGLWIHRSVAAALNDIDAEDMRVGFSTGTYNSRGVHFVDPTGKPELELSKNYRQKAEELVNAGFSRFAVTLENLADGYKREANEIMAENLKEVP